MKRILISLFFLSLFKIVFSQTCVSTPQKNLQKYWEYRERLKDFVVSGADTGCSLVAKNRSASTLFFDDEPAYLGYYIGVLATEYYLLDKQATDTASSNQKQRTIEDLYYALTAADRIDNDAEIYWKQYYSGSPYSTSNGQKNGFLIRDDVTSNFPNQIENNDYVENNLNKSLSPPPDGSSYRASTINSGFTAGTSETGKSFYGLSCLSENGQNGGPRTTSIDEITQLYIGLALVSKLIPSTVTFKSRHLYQIADSTAARISLLALTGQLTNPITSKCGTGVEWHNFKFFDPCKCDGGGSDVSPLSSVLSLNLLDGVLLANCCIQNGFTTNCGVSIVRRWWYYKYKYIGERNEFMVLALAAIGHVWGILTSTTISKKALKAEFDTKKPGRCTIDPLVYEALWNNKVTGYPGGFFEALLNEAPCHGIVGNDGNYEWSGGNRALDGPNSAKNSFSDIFSGIDYMLFFNLYNLDYDTINSSTLQYVPYHYIHPKDLRFPYLIKTHYMENDVKNFYAADSIKAGSIAPDSANYTIANDNDVNQPLSNGRAQVAYKAGHRIDLMPGFEAQSGVLFDADIDTSIHAMDCTNCIDTVPLEGPPWFPVDSITSFNYFSIDTFNICDGCDTLHFFGINGDTGGVKSWNWNFGNGDSSTSYNPSVRYCNSTIIDTNTGIIDTAYELRLIVEDTADVIDTFYAVVYIECLGSGGIEKQKSKPQKILTINDTASFKVLNNITTGGSKITYHIPQQDNVTITIFNLFGEKIGTLVQTVQNGGDYSINIDNGKFADGMYFITMQTSNSVQTKKLVVIRR